MQSEGVVVADGVVGSFVEAHVCLRLVRTWYTLLKTRLWWVGAWVLFEVD